MADLSERVPFDAVRERAIRFGPARSLVGIITEPKSDLRRPPVLILGAGILHKVGPSRASVELAAFLGAKGHVVLRFDLSGIGDSGSVQEASLQETVKRDMSSAVCSLLDEVDGAGHFYAVGYCSGADNGLHLAFEDERCRGVVMFDPTVHSTRGFVRRRFRNRVLSSISWSNLLSGRSLALRFAELFDRSPKRPPGYFGLLVSGPAETDRRVAEVVGRGSHLLYCLSRGAHSYCNAPQQVEESLPHGFSDSYVTVAWRPDLDHILSSKAQRREFASMVLEWMEQVEGSAIGS